MNCTQCSELLVNYSRNALPAHSRAEVSSHLPGCSSCSAEFARLQELEFLLDTTEQPSARLQENFQARLTAEMVRTTCAPQPKLRSWSGLFQTLWPSRPFAATCYSVALLACGLISGQLLPPSTLGFAGDYTAQRTGTGNAAQICSIPGSANNEVL